MCVCVCKYIPTFELGCGDALVLTEDIWCEEKGVHSGCEPRMSRDKVQGYLGILAKGLRSCRGRDSNAHPYLERGVGTVPEGCAEPEAQVVDLGSGSGSG
jgi:hypothetical protein